jgi:spore germination cell wall hydrolase CwlJ-like protein
MKQTLFVIALLFSAVAWRAHAESVLTGYNRELIAACLVLEAGGEGSDGMQAVLNVIVNRAEGHLHRMVPETIKPGAFSCMSGIWNISAPDYGPLIRRATKQRGVYQAALQLISILENGLLTDNTGGATHYHAVYIRPYWADHLHYLVTIGNHIFYIEPGRQVASL